ncbi:hypothetical protein IG631_22306 [Alternaria alternata]|jgi:hypothetical protein|nr:hypothetical protein IG631_22306 [Alternaria alternata]
MRQEAALAGVGERQHTSCLLGRGCGGDKNGSHRLVFAQGGQGMVERYSGWHAVDDVPPDARPGGG